MYLYYRDLNLTLQIEKVIDEKGLQGKMFLRKICFDFVVKLLNYAFSSLNSASFENSKKYSKSGKFKSLTAKLS